MNKKGQGDIIWLIVLLVVFIIINKMSLWIHGSTLDATNQWISIVTVALIETGIAWAIRKSK